MKLHLTYYKDKTHITVQDQIVEVKAYQIICWVSVSLRSMLECDEKIPKIPAILDTGNTHNFAISQEQLQKWAGIHPDSLRLLTRLRDKKQLVPVRAASLWLRADEPFRMDIDEGIGVYERDGPRLPILGLRALTNSRLQIVIYADQKRGIIQTPEIGIGHSESDLPCGNRPIL